MASRLHGRLPVVATGGVFQNARLAGLLVGNSPAVSMYTTRSGTPGGWRNRPRQAVVASAIASS